MAADSVKLQWWPAFSKLHLLRKEDPVAVAFDVSPRRGTNEIFTRMSGTSVSGDIVTSLFSGKGIRSYITIWPWNFHDGRQLLSLLWTKHNWDKVCLYRHGYAAT